MAPGEGGGADNQATDKLRLQHFYTAAIEQASESIGRLGNDRGNSEKAIHQLRNNRRRRTSPVTACPRYRRRREPARRLQDRRCASCSSRSIARMTITPATAPMQARAKPAYPVAGTGNPHQAGEEAVKDTGRFAFFCSEPHHENRDCGRRCSARRRCCSRRARRGPGPAPGARARRTHPGHRRPSPEVGRLGAEEPGPGRARAGRRCGPAAG